MNKKELTIKWGIVALIVFVAALFRFTPYLFGTTAFNFTPIGAMALFGGAYFSKKYLAFLFPLLALWVSNLVINNAFLAEYYDGFAFFGSWQTYLVILLIVGLGILLLKKVTMPRVFIASLSASVLFFVVSNFLVWAQGTMYPMNIAGLMNCYAMGLPFFGNTIASDLLFSALLFGGFEMVKMWKPNLAFQKA